MKKSEFIAEVAKRVGVSQAKTGEMVNMMLDVIMEALKADDKVTLTGFGTFEARQRAARKGRDIRTKAAITIPASKRPVFTAGAVLKEAVHPKAAASVAANVTKTAKPAAGKAPKAAKATKAK